MTKAWTSVWRHISLRQLFLSGVFGADERNSHWKCGYTPAWGCNHQSFACPSYNLMFICSGNHANLRTGTNAQVSLETTIKPPDLVQDLSSGGSTMGLMGAYPPQFRVKPPIFKLQRPPRTPPLWAPQNTEAELLQFDKSKTATGPKTSQHCTQWEKLQ